ncbi:MAG TPA: monovalent cation:proton antiporter-2 (CPA2) family protein, partial [Burkholderiales bacterium]|nr:monovalent cation:proton antiporter-2 (CPA2) family protein [Burkholderiales bacterium]
METHSYLPQALVCLAAGVLAVPIFRQLGLGSVLGYLIAGVAIGPWGLGLIADPQRVLQFSELGVVLLLFLIGLELSVERVWSLRRAIFGLGAVQVAATIAAVAAIAVTLGQPLAVGVVAGMGIAMSSTAIGLATLTEKNLLQTPGGQASFAVLLFQDLAVVPLLLVLRVLGGESEGIDVADLAKAVGMIVLLIAAGRVLVRPVLRFVAQARLREVFVGFSLLVVLGTAALMEWAGLSQALGAFLAGVMLADSEYRHELELDIEPFKGLLLGLFFIAVGMSVDLGLFLRVPWLVLGLALGIVALKLVLLFPMVQLFGYCTRADGLTFAVALSQAGEFAFVLFGAAGRILPAETAALLNAAVAVSMLTTPFLFRAREKLKLGEPEDRAADPIRESNPIIVAGFGRFGQVVMRVLRGLGVGATVIDHDPVQIETVRRFGWKAYYGDATRMDLLESAGARGAKLLLVAIDDPEGAMRMVKNARRYFPDLPIVVRARSRTDAYEYAEMGVPAVREVIGSALDAAGLVLGRLGYSEREAETILRRFKEYDEQQIVRNAPHRHDLKKLIALNEQGRRDIAELLAAEARSAPQVDQDD